MEKKQNELSIMEPEVENKVGTLKTSQMEAAQENTSVPTDGTQAQQKKLKKNTVGSSAAADGNIPPSDDIENPSIRGI